MAYNPNDFFQFSLSESSDETDENYKQVETKEVVEPIIEKPVKKKKIPKGNSRSRVNKLSEGLLNAKHMISGVINTQEPEKAAQFQGLINEKAQREQQKSKNIAQPGRQTKVVMSKKEFERIATTSPQNTECRFIPFSELVTKIFHTEQYLRPGETGVNTFIDNYDPFCEDKLQYFVKDTSLVSTDLTEISKMSTESIMEQLKWANEELDLLPVDSEGVFNIVTGLDEKVNDSITIVADINKLDWKKFGETCKFDVILMDPPWTVNMATIGNSATNQLEYMTLSIPEVASMGIPFVQDNGYCFMWVIMIYFQQAIEMMLDWGYEIEGLGNWIKMGPSGKIVSSNAYYVGHGKETLIVGRKGTPPPIANIDLFQDIIYSARNTRQSHKPEDLYDIIERMFPNCTYLELFARNHNLRSGWVSLGIQAK